MKKVKIEVSCQTLVEAHDLIGQCIYATAQPRDRSGKLLQSVLQEVFEKMGKKIVNKLGEKKTFQLTLKMHEAVAVWYLLSEVPNLDVQLKLMFGQIDQQTI